ncbi:hypothetical protein DLC15_10655 [Salmonella enterica subsp. enterica serovar Telelkebir]|nr:hypothetical protein [Salmonella enterica]EBG8221540.1 hypothetical protein [Salmonella enterica subsp. enterica]EBU8553023.1 hypothetical protein [Salmonella enterica subsp. enterica serovar Telelkebir]ECA9844096.1 hypothetical protein [Salmonella enterica subsp. enterica serovar Essen]ECB1174587.1 hypothetical protein [Salmonella enterica subsp. enterica serovar Essen]
MIRNKTAFTGLFVLSTCLSGCASVDSVNGAISQISGGMLSKGAPQASHKIAQEYRVPVDVDTAAARVKRYYGFVSVEEVAQLRNNGTQSGGWTAASVVDGAWVWDGQPGSYYKMGRDWGSENINDSIQIELEKNGSGSRMYITFRSGLASHATAAYTSKLFENMKSVAEGTVR